MTPNDTWWHPNAMDCLQDVDLVTINVLKNKEFLTFSAFFKFPIIWILIVLMKNLQEQVKEAFCFQNNFWPFTAWINCSSDLNKFCEFSAFSLEFLKFFLMTRKYFLTKEKIILVTKYHYLMKSVWQTPIPSHKRFSHENEWYPPIFLNFFYYFHQR